jgi:hypothetical protein
MENNLYKRTCIVKVVNKKTGTIKEIPRTYLRVHERPGRPQSISVNSIAKELKKITDKDKLQKIYDFIINIQSTD